MTQLHEIGAQFDFLNSIEDIDEDVFNDTLEGILGEFEEVATALAAAMKNTESDIDQLKQFEAKVKGKRASLERKHEKMRSYLLTQMLNAKIGKIKAPMFTISTAKTAEAIEVFDETAVPEEYVTTESVIKVDKQNLKKSLQAGQKIAGARLLPRGDCLRIR